MIRTKKKAFVLVGVRYLGQSHSNETTYHYHDAKGLGVRSGDWIDVPVLKRGDVQEITALAQVTQVVMPVQDREVLDYLRRTTKQVLRVHGELPIAGTHGTVIPQI